MCIIHVCVPRWEEVFGVWWITLSVLHVFAGRVPPSLRSLVVPHLPAGEVPASLEPCGCGGSSDRLLQSQCHIVPDVPKPRPQWWGNTCAPLMHWATHGVDRQAQLLHWHEGQSTESPDVRDIQVQTKGSVLPVEVGWKWCFTKLLTTALGWVMS